MHSALPDGYQRTTVRDVIVIAPGELLDFTVAAVRAAGSLHAYALTHAHDRPLQGRGRVYRIAAPHADWVVRHYRRGGLVAPLLNDAYLRLGAPRPLRELHASEQARARGIDTPRVVAVAIAPRGPFYRADIATQYIEDAIDLATITFGNDAALSGTPAPALARRSPFPSARSQSILVEAWAAAGALVRRTAHAGVLHADLNLKNILIAGAASSPSAWLIDLDRCRIRSAASDRDLGRMLERIHRSREKLERSNGSQVPESALEAFHAALRG